MSYIRMHVDLVKCVCNRRLDATDEVGVKTAGLMRLDVRAKFCRFTREPSRVLTLKIMPFAPLRHVVFCNH